MSGRSTVPGDERGLARARGTQGADTVEDLLDLAAARKARVPPLLVMTLLVQLLKALRDLHRRGIVDGSLSPRSLALSGRRAETLFDDPSRDPGLELLRAAPDEAFLAPEVRAGGPPTPASDLYGAGAVAVALLTGRAAGGHTGNGRTGNGRTGNGRTGNGRTGTGRTGGRRYGLGALEALVDGLVEPRPEARWTVSRALGEARIRALELFEAWDRNRHGKRLRALLAAALETRRGALVAELLPDLAEVSPGDPLISTARRWLAGRSQRESELRHRLTRAIYLGNVREAAWREQQLRFFLAERAGADGDLEIACRWLGEQAEAEEVRREGVKRCRLKLMLTALPLAFAFGLILLLVGVLIWA